MTLTQADFLLALATEFAPPGTTVDATTGLFDDLGLDSLAAFRLVIWIEDLAGVLYAEDESVLFVDAGGAYAHYRRLVVQPTGRVG